MPTLEWIGKEKVINHHQEASFRVLKRQHGFDENGQTVGGNGSGNMIIRATIWGAQGSVVPVPGPDEARLYRPAPTI